MATARIWGCSLRSSGEPRDKKWRRELLCVTSPFSEPRWLFAALQSLGAPVAFVWGSERPRLFRLAPSVPCPCPSGCTPARAACLLRGCAGSQRPAQQASGPSLLPSLPQRSLTPVREGEMSPTPSALPHFQSQTLSSLAPMSAMEVKFQHLLEVPVSPRALASAPSVVHVVMATQARDPRDGRAELMAVPDKGFLSWRG